VRFAYLHLFWYSQNGYIWLLWTKKINGKELNNNFIVALMGLPSTLQYIEAQSRSRGKTNDQLFWFKI